MTKNLVAAALFMLALASAPAAQADSGAAAELLAAQNVYRQSLGLMPLRWSEQLAARAQEWADHLAALGRLEHSGPGQNLAMATSGYRTLTQLVNLWGREKAHFVNGIFPEISTTRNWMDVGHYSQLIWKTTTQVGCGFARNEGHDVLVCNYDPPGNVVGDRAF